MCVCVCVCVFLFLFSFLSFLVWGWGLGVGFNEKLGSTAIGIQTNDGVVLAVEKRITSTLMEPSSIEKVVEIDSHIGVYHDLFYPQKIPCLFSIILCAFVLCSFVVH